MNPSMFCKNLCPFRLHCLFDAYGCLHPRSRCERDFGDLEIDAFLWGTQIRHSKFLLT